LQTKLAITRLPSSQQYQIAKLITSLPSEHRHNIKASFVTEQLNSLSAAYPLSEFRKA